MKLEKRMQRARNRNRYKDVPHSDYVATILAKYYTILKEEFKKEESKNFNAMTYGDIFHETILYVIQDQKAFNLPEEDLIKHFRYRYNMIKFQIVRDSNLIINTDANNLQTKEESE